MLGIKSLTRVLARLGTPAGASVSVDIAALKTALDALGLQYIEGSVSDAGPAAADFDTDLTEVTDNHYNGMLLMFTDGVCAGQAHVIDDYDGAAKNVSFSAEDIWTEAPGDGDNFIILPSTGSMAKAIYTRLGAPAGASVSADLATIAALLDPEIANIITSQSRQLFSMDFWSAGLEEVQIDAAGATVALPDITVADLPAGATIVKANIMFKFRMIENTNVAANKLNGATVALTSQVIQIRSDAPLAYVDAINFIDDFFAIAATTREGGDVIIGTIDVSGAAGVDENDTYNLRWLLGRADLDFINFNDVQVGLRIWYSV